MDVRVVTEGFEKQTLAPWATLSVASTGRVHQEEPDDLRTAFQRDRDRVLHTKAFRRLMHKTQVFIATEMDHYRTRLTHTLEVAQVARTICRALRLNGDLVEAICLAHDLGHTPFGHVGEDVLSGCIGRPFEHNRQSLRVVDHLERDGAGLNLTFEVRDGILNHTWKMPEPSTPEANVARWSDRIAYVHHDTDDAIRAGVIEESDLPGDVVAELGKSHGARLDRCVRELVKASVAAGDIEVPAAVAEAMAKLRAFLFERVYLGPEVRSQAAKAETILRTLYDHFSEKSNAEQVTDYVSGMTDRFAIKTYESL